MDKEHTMKNEMMGITLIIKAETLIELELFPATHELYKELQINEQVLEVMDSESLMKSEMMAIQIQVMADSTVSLNMDGLALTSTTMEDSKGMLFTNT